ncbi:ANTAR domain-containing protein [Streptomyces sp. NPDC096040]|uniref:ANTAR domain-containing protein n=1 Tax=Streptomyces sp. NPDC096040 TaxID=3155541 RepID=UPI0033260140
MPETPFEGPSTSPCCALSPSSSAGALRVWTGPDGGRVTVTVSGECSLDESEHLRRALRNALTRSVHGVDLDLGGLVFADCAALNVLLALRSQAVAAGKTVVVTAAGTAVERLLTLTDTYELFSSAHDHTDRREDPDPGDHTGPCTDTGDRLLQTEVVQLRRALRTRPDIDMARGILMASFGLKADQAWEVLVSASQHTNTKLHRLAQDVVTAVRGAPLRDTVQKQLTAAVARTRGPGGP